MNKPNLLGHILTVLDSRRFRSIYVVRKLRDNWTPSATLPDGTAVTFRLTTFGRNTKRFKAYCDDATTSKPISSVALKAACATLRGAIK